MKSELVDIDSAAFIGKVTEIFSALNKKETATPSRFIKLPDGWIYDKQTSLEWGPSSSSSMNFPKSEEYCKKQNGRLPTVDELQTILDRTKYNPTSDKSVFTDVKSEWYWTSNKYMGCSGAFWCVSFGHGGVGNFFEYGSNYVRPVRSSQ